MHVIIMRGITGSGKSSIVRRLFKTAVVCSADHYFERKKMHWNPKFLKNAHDECYAKFMEALSEEEPLIVIDNNNLKSRDFSDYVEDAIDNGYDVTFFHVMCSPDVAAVRSKHAKSIAEQGMRHVWKHHHQVEMTPAEVNGERVDSTEVWTSEHPGAEPIWEEDVREERPGQASRGQSPEPTPGLHPG